jgi:hypothetical protein
VWLRLSLASLSAALAAGCLGSDSNTYDAKDVRDALTAQGFEVDFECGTGERTVEAESCVGERRGKAVTFLSAILSGGDLKDVRSVLVGKASEDPGVTAWILASEASADSWLRGWRGRNEIAVGLQDRNLVLVVPRRQEARARAAVEDLD